MFDMSTHNQSDIECVRGGEQFEIHGEEEGQKSLKRPPRVYFSSEFSKTQFFWSDNESKQEKSFLHPFSEAE